MANTSQHQPIQDFLQREIGFYHRGYWVHGENFGSKSLKSIPDIGRLYLLIRPSLNKDVYFRLQKELIDCEVR